MKDIREINDLYLGSIPVDSKYRVDIAQGVENEALEKLTRRSVLVNKLYMAKPKLARYNAGPNGGVYGIRW